MPSPRLWLLKMLLVTSLACSRAAAQDTRKIVEPRLPPVCKVLTAELTPVGGGLPDGVERHYRDTARVEKAMRHCEPGTSVILRVGNSGKTVFLLGPTRLSAGVTLVVEAEVAVWGSRDPRNYDVTPGSCGTVGKEGCKPLIIAQDAAHAGLMGEGVVDGRGGTRLLLPDGKEGGTWWELARAARLEGARAEVPPLLVVRRSNDFSLYRIGLRNAPGSHVFVEATDGLTAWRGTVDAPPGARSADGIGLGPGTANISFVEMAIRTGGAGLAMMAGERGSVTRITFAGSHLYAGRGLMVLRAGSASGATPSRWM